MKFIVIYKHHDYCLALGMVLPINCNFPVPEGHPVDTKPQSPVLRTPGESCEGNHNAGHLCSAPCASTTTAQQIQSDKQTLSAGIDGK